MMLHLDMRRLVSHSAYNEVAHRDPFRQRLSGIKYLLHRQTGSSRTVDISSQRNAMLSAQLASRK